MTAARGAHPETIDRRAADKHDWQEIALTLRGHYEAKFGCNINAETGECLTHMKCRWGRYVRMVRNGHSYCGGNY